MASDDAGGETGLLDHLEQTGDGFFTSSGEAATAVVRVIFMVGSIGG